MFFKEWFGEKLEFLDIMVLYIYSCLLNVIWVFVRRGLRIANWDQKAILKKLKEQLFDIRGLGMSGQITFIKFLKITFINNRTYKNGLYAHALFGHFTELSNNHLLTTYKHPYMNHLSNQLIQSDINYQLIQSANNYRLSANCHTELSISLMLVGNCLVFHFC